MILNLHACMHGIQGTVTSRQTFPVKRIAFVKDVANDTFCDIKDHSKCFQVNFTTSSICGIVII